MKMRAVLIWAVAILIGTTAALILWPSPPAQRPPYMAPANGIRTLFPSLKAQERLLTIEAATDVSFMRQFVAAFQKTHPHVAVLYVDMLSSDLLAHALTDCSSAHSSPDLFLSISTDHLIELANRGCAAPLPSNIAALAPASAQWRREVVAFSIEPAVFIYNKRLFAPAQVPKNHVDLIEAMRGEPQFWQRGIGTYDIEQSGTGYNYANMDARQTAIYGRLIESFGRSRIVTYCCSNEMVDAVARGDIKFAYNVQLSYAYAGQRMGQPIGVVLPDDYQTVQARSVMISKSARNAADAIGFVKTLLSPTGQKIAQTVIAPPAGKTTLGRLDVNGSTSQLTLNSSLLSLRDQARRNHFIRDWRRAIRPASLTDAGEHGVTEPRPR